MRIRFGVVDDHSDWRWALIDIIKGRFADADIVVEATNGLQLIEALAENPADQAPQMIILDLKMPLMDGFETAQWLHSNKPDIRMLTLSLDQDETSIIKLIRYGVSGFCNKVVHGDELIRGIEMVMQGNLYISPFFNQHGALTQLKNDFLPDTTVTVNTFMTLDAEDKSLLTLFCSELTRNEIIKQLGTNQMTFEQRIGKLYKAFGVHDRIGLFLLLFKNQLV
jgi:DNA-binding NarL/FixJ family response regulator